MHSKVHQRLNRQFSGSFIGFVLILIMIRVGIGWFIPYHLGGKELSEKIRHIEGGQKQVDILFMGSSRVRRGIIPTQMDSILSGWNRTNVSFNLGGPAASMGENLYLLRHYSASPAAAHLKIVVVEWAGEYLQEKQYYKTERASYWMDIESFSQQVSLLHESPGMMAAWSDGRLSSLFSAFLHRNIGLGSIRTALMDSMVLDESLNEQRGYSRLKNRHARLLSCRPVIPGKPVYDPLQAGRDRERALHLHGLKEIDPVEEDVRLWQGLIREYESRGIRLILLIPPGPVNIRQIALARRIPSDHLLDLSHPKEYPDLYDPEIFFDFVHLNHEGAQRFTSHIAKSFLQHGDKFLNP